MDSKYSIFSKNKSTLAESSPFSQNLKRKFTYGLSASVPAKKPHIQITPKPIQKLNSTQTATSKNVVQDIQFQRKQLPVFAVREQ